MARNLGKGARWIQDHLDYDGDECLLWPYSKHPRGYGLVGYLGKLRRANRLMCELAHGPAPSPKHHAAHSCGNASCMNPRHLSWKDQSDNEKDKRRHGTVGKGKGSRTKLPLATISEIRANKGKIGQLTLAKKLGLKLATIRYWQKHSHDPHPPGQSASTVRLRAKTNISLRA